MTSKAEQYESLYQEANRLWRIWLDKYSKENDFCDFEKYSYTPEFEAFKAANQKATAFYREWTDK